MNKLLHVVIGVLVATFLISVGAASLSYAQTKNETVQDRLFLENVEKFEEWRQGIPDFEKRLYDRVKAVNKRVIRVQNLVIASFFLLLLINFVFLAMIYRRIKARSVDSQPGAPSSTPPPAPEESANPTP